MCGIAGYIGKSVGNDKDIISKMNDVLNHRGPDGVGYFIDDNVVLGHTRLSIIDLTDAGHQPMSYMNRYVITFNGEIYNHLEIRSELESFGYCFASHTDTEVIMAAYDRWGVECLKKFNGMWAFCIYDRHSQKVFISRDRFGIKPLYYYSDENLFVFSSEIKSILTHPSVKTSPNVIYLDRYVKDGACEYSKETAFNSIYRFSIASYIEVDKKMLLNGFQEQKFWSVEPNCSNEAFEESKLKEYSEKYYLLLEDSVRLRLRADVKVGSALSGGLDSSSIVYLVNKLLKEQGKEELQETFSSVYKSKGTTECDESVYIEMLAQHLQVNSNPIEPIAEEIPYKHSMMINAMECPPDNTCMSGWHTFQKVSETNVKVTLDGQGADEQIAGYLYYYFIYFSSLPLSKLIEEYKQCSSTPGVMKHIVAGIVANILSKVIGRVKTKKLIEKMNLITNFDFNLNEVLIKDMHTDLITLIHYSDRVSMAHSIESRMPFMDYRLVEFLASVPACYKLRAGWTKYLARTAFDKKLPDEIVWRKDKMGWPIPESYWFYKVLNSWVKDMINSENRLKNHFDIKNLLNNFSEMKNLKETVKALNLAAWYSRFFPNDSR